MSGSGSLDERGGGSILVGPGGRWACDKRRGAFVVDGESFCPDCGRRIREWFRVRPARPLPEYKRVHVGTWGFWGAC